MHTYRLYPFEYKGTCFFYDSETGVISRSAQIVNEIIKRIHLGHEKKSIINSLKALDNHEALETVYSELETYISDRFLTTSDRKDSLIRKKSNISKEDWYEGKVLKTLWLSITHNCNLRCSYCYAAGGTYGNKALMSIATATKCIDFFFKYLKEDANTVSVNFFGGEPLLNKKTLIFSVGYINELAYKLGKRVNYLITTNGTIIEDDLVKIIVENNICLNISIDGSEDTHNANRIFLNGKGSFALVKKNIQSLVNIHDNIVARLTLTKKGIQFFKEDVLYLWGLGLNCIYIEPVITKDPELEIDKLALDQFEKQLEETIQIMQGEPEGDQKMLSNIIMIKNRIVNRIIQPVCSYYSTSTIMFTPEGHIYKCNKTIGDQDHCVGSIEQGITWDKLSEKFTPDVKCLNCWARRICGGSCDVVEKSYLTCRFQKILIEKSLKYYAALQHLSS
jgi:radical SAM additional 4Fe4S-binding domain